MKIRAIIIKTGMNKSINGGGGSGGSTSGSTKSDAVNTTKTTMDISVKYLSMTYALHHPILLSSYQIILLMPPWINFMRLHRHPPLPTTPFLVNRLPESAVVVVGGRRVVSGGGRREGISQEGFLWKKRFMEAWRKPAGGRKN